MIVKARRDRVLQKSTAVEIPLEISTDVDILGLDLMEPASEENQAVGTEPALPDAELEVLACLWKQGEATARDVREAMAAYRPLTHSAVSTLLARLQEKGLVDRRKGPVGKAFLFRAVGRPTTTRRRLVGELLERVFGGDALAVVSSLFETRPPNADELDHLERMLAELRSSAAAEPTSSSAVRKRGKRR
jgi:BlaI family transcriptional regulator, penicillinase repressor